MLIEKLRASLRVAVISSIFLAIASLNTPAMGQQGAFDEINIFAEQFCGQYLLEGGDRESGLTGEAEADLGEFLKHLVDVGISGGVEFSVSEYIGVVREHLAGELKSVRDCRVMLWNDLKTLVIPVYPEGTNGSNAGWG